MQKYILSFFGSEIKSVTYLDFPIAVWKLVELIVSVIF